MKHTRRLERFLLLLFSLLFAQPLQAAGPEDSDGQPPFAPAPVCHVAKFADHASELRKIARSIQAITSPENIIIFAGDLPHWVGQYFSFRDLQSRPNDKRRHYYFAPGADIYDTSSTYPAYTLSDEEESTYKDALDDSGVMEALYEAFQTRPKGCSLSRDSSGNGRPDLLTDPGAPTRKRAASVLKNRKILVVGSWNNASQALQCIKYIGERALETTKAFSHWLLGNTAYAFLGKETLNAPEHSPLLWGLFSNLSMEIKPIHTFFLKASPGLLQDCEYETLGMFSLSKLMEKRAEIKASNKELQGQIHAMLKSSWYMIIAGHRPLDTEHNETERAFRQAIGADLFAAINDAPPPC